jgi:hypothetical protein
MSKAEMFSAEEQIDAYLDGARVEGMDGGTARLLRGLEKLHSAPPRAGFQAELRLTLRSQAVARPVGPSWLAAWIDGWLRGPRAPLRLSLGAVAIVVLGVGAGHSAAGKRHRATRRLREPAGAD